jgi:hypothetical protein
VSAKKNAGERFAGVFEIRSAKRDQRIG